MERDMEHKCFICFECLKSFISIDILINHIRNFHLLAQDFVCKQVNCYRTFSRLNRLKYHLVTHHTKCEMVLQSNVGKQFERFNNAQIHVLEHENVAQDKFECTTNSNDDTFGISKLVYNGIIHFISKMYNSSSLPRNIVTDVISNVKELTEDIFVSIESTLKKQNVAEDALNTVRTINSEVNNIFEMLDTEHKRLKVLKNSKCYIEPSRFFIGERLIKKVDKKKSYEANMVIENAEG